MPSLRDGYAVWLEYACPEKELLNIYIGAVVLFVLGILPGDVRKKGPFDTLIL